MELRLCMAGFGAVGQRLCRLLEEKRQELEEQFHLRVKLVGVCTRSQGALVNPEGIALDSLFDQEGNRISFARHPDYRQWTVLDMVDGVEADALVEVTTLSIRDGEPARTHITRALERGMHVITANKGPIAWYYRELERLAREKGKQLLYETIVMDGTPVFNLVEDTLRGNRILGLRGILNGTTNFLLQQLEQGLTYEQAIRRAQEIQLAEADPSLDVDGWDGAAKICAMANVFMGANMTPMQVEVESLRSVTLEDMERARKAGKKIKYICQAQREDGAVKLWVKPQELEPTDPLYSVDGTSAGLTLYTDLAGELTMLQTDPGILQTAYGVYSDILTLAGRLKD